MTKINSQAYDANYSKGINDITFKKIDNTGDKDSKISTEEVHKDLGINFMPEGQNVTDTFKIASSTSDMPEVLKKYAGKDGEFSTKEWTDFLNGDECCEALEAWQSSEKMAELEKDWVEAENLYHQEMDNIENKGDKITIEAIEEALANLDIISLLKS